MESKQNKKVSWNASEGIIMEISNRRVAANTFYINNNINKAMNNLIAIKHSVVQSFNLDERKKLKDIEERFNKFSLFLNVSMAQSFNETSRKAYSVARGIAVKIYFEYNDLLMDLLEDRGYLIGEQSDASRMKF